LRIGIHLGEVRTSNNDAFEDGVNIASGPQAASDPHSWHVGSCIYQCEEQDKR